MYTRANEVDGGEGGGEPTGGAEGEEKKNMRREWERDAISGMERDRRGGRRGRAQGGRGSISRGGGTRSKDERGRERGERRWAASFDLTHTRCWKKDTRISSAKRPIHIHDPRCARTRKKPRERAHRHAAALSLLFNVVCTHIVRVHAINLYGRFRGPGEGAGEEERAECAGEVSALN